MEVYPMKNSNIIETPDTMDTLALERRRLSEDDRPNSPTFSPTNKLRVGVF